MIKRAIEIFKTERLIYLIEEEVITVFTGTFCLFLQFEKSDSDDDYTALQVWISDEDNEVDGIYHEIHDDFTFEELDEAIYEGLVHVREINQNIGKLSNKLKEIEDLVNENNIPRAVIDRMWNSLEFETE
jgi:hypothetical protein